MPRARLGELLTPLVSGIGRKPPLDRGIRRRGNPELGQHPDGVELAGRLDHPRQHQLVEHLIGTGLIQSQHPVGGGERLPQVLGPAGHDRCLSGVELAIVEVEGVLVGPQPLLRDGLQHLDLTRTAGRADVLDLAGTAPIRVHDLDRGRPAGGPHRPHISHSDRLKTPNPARV